MSYFNKRIFDFCKVSRKISINIYCFLIFDWNSIDNINLELFNNRKTVVKYIILATKYICPRNVIENSELILYRIISMSKTIRASHHLSRQQNFPGAFFICRYSESLNHWIFIFTATRHTKFELHDFLQVQNIVNVNIYIILYRINHGKHHTASTSTSK